MKKEFLAVAFLLLFLVIVLFRIKQDFKTALLLDNITSLLHKSELASPLADKDPISDLAALLREKKIDTVASPIASDSAILVTIESEETQVLFSANKDLVLQVSTLQIILNKLTIEARVARKIDFRFEDPIVVY